MLYSSSPSFIVESRPVILKYVQGYTWTGFGIFTLLIKSSLDISDTTIVVGSPLLSFADKSL